MTKTCEHGEIREESQRCEEAVVVLDSLSAGVLAARSDGVITWANPWAGSVLRRSPRALLGRRLVDVLPPLEPLFEGEGAMECRRGELTLRAEDGTPCTVGFSITGREPSGPTDVAVIVLFQEIGGLVELRRQRDRLLQMAALGDALPAVLHEVRNPLAAITTALEVLTEETQAGPLQADLYAVLNEARRATLTLEGLGGLARDRHTRKWSAIDLAVEEAARVLEPTAARRGIAVRTTSRTLPLLPLDRGAISGVVFNLVRNAIDACREGDFITVDARLVSPKQLVLEVADTGHGMTEETAARCADLFFTTKDTGSGIGLALCKKFAESTGGSLEVESQVGKGTIVRVLVMLKGEQGG